MARIERIAPLLPANDVSQSVAWYEQHLGFKTIFVDDETRPTYAGLMRDGGEIHLFEHRVDPKASHWMCYLRVEAIETLYGTLARDGLIHPNGALADKPWGQREFAILDPNGTLLTFGQAAD